MSIVNLHPISCAMLALERRVPLDKKLGSCLKIQPLDLTSPPLNFKYVLQGIPSTAGSPEFGYRPKEYASLVEHFYAVIKEM